MARMNEQKLKFQREIEHYRNRYERKNLRYVRNNWVFYWRFLAYLEDIGYQPGTVQRYYGQLRAFLHWLGGKSLRRVRRTDIEQYLVKHRQERQRVAYTIRYLRESLVMFFGFVMRFSAMRANPAAGLKIRTHFPQPENMDYFMQDEVMMLVGKPVYELERVRRAYYPTEHAYKGKVYKLKMDRLVLKLLFSTGVRPCELANLELQDFQPQHYRLRIRSKGRQRYVVRDRHVFLTENTVEQLQELIGLGSAVRGERSADRVFIHYRGGAKICARDPNRIVKYWARRCGIIRNVYAYMARYTYCTRLVENGVDLYSLQKLMGHKQPAVTLKHYLKLTESEVRKEWRKYNPLQVGDTQ